MTTKIHHAAVVAILPLAAALSVAFAADSADLTVKGTIKPAPCTVKFTGDAVIDFGTIPMSSLSESAATRLASKLFTLTIRCDAATKVALSTIDGRKGTADDMAGNAIVASDLVWYGIGSVDGKRIGAYTLQRNAQTLATADGEDASTLYSADEGGSWRSTDQTDWLAPETRSYGWSSGGASAPGAFKTVAQQWQLDVAIGQAKDLPTLTRVIHLDGLVTFQVKYL